MQVPDTLVTLRQLADHFEVRDLSEVVLGSNAFQTCSGSSYNPKHQHHHYGDGGLLQHTYEVVTLGLKTIEVLGSQIDPKLYFLAALFHDIGKTEDYAKNLDGNWISTRHKFLVHHIVRSAIVWENFTKSSDLYHDEIEDVTHAILAHHGRKDWGSPVEPQSKMAWLLHLSDMMSARLHDTSDNTNGSAAH